MKLLLPACLLLLAACASHDFTYRGYTHHSSCTEVESTELKQGAAYASQRTASDGAAHVQVTTLHGHLYGAPVLVHISCTGPDVEAITYEESVGSNAEGAALFDHLSAELARQFGPPHDESRASGRRHSFMCDPATAMMQLSEELGGAADAQSRVRLLVVPQPKNCPPGS
jgi:hypothetical protein